jgi:hypothetical protein
MLSVLRLDVYATQYHHTIMKYSYAGPPRAGLGPGEIFFRAPPARGKIDSLLRNVLELV